MALPESIKCPGCGEYVVVKVDHCIEFDHHCIELNLDLLYRYPIKKGDVGLSAEGATIITLQKDLNRRFKQT